MADIEVKVPDIGDFKDVPVVTVLVKPQALLAGPLGLAVLCADIAWGKEKRAQTLKRAGIGVVAGLAAATLVLLPFLQGVDQPLAWLVDKSETATQLPA